MTLGAFIDQLSIVNVDKEELIYFWLQHQRNLRGQLICYLESSLGDSPSSLSSTSLEDAPPPHTERDQVRSSGRNQLGRTYSPGLPLSMCEREEIVKLFQ
ncbi:hypothetical protein ANCDUO_23514, partial [Ancylostoma duodenale]